MTLKDESVRRGNVGRKISVTDFDAGGVAVRSYRLAPQIARSRVTAKDRVGKFVERPPSRGEGIAGDRQTLLEKPQGFVQANQSDQGEMQNDPGEQKVIPAWHRQGAREQAVPALTSFCVSPASPVKSAMRLLPSQNKPAAASLNPMVVRVDIWPGNS